MLVLVVQGFANKRMGDELNVSEPTVKFHRGRLMDKMGADSLPELVRIAEKLGIPGQVRPPTA